MNLKTPTSYNVNIEEWPLDLLADYIQKTHHQFTDQILVEIKTNVNAYLAAKTGEEKKISAFKVEIELLAKELGGHMKKEELMLFPYVRKMMIHEHDTAFQLLTKIRIILDHYEKKESESDKMKK